MVDFCTDSSIAAGDRAPLHFALHTVFDRAGDIDRAFDHLAQANAIMRRDNPFVIAETRDHFERLKAVFTKSLLAAPVDAAPSSELLIFVLGMPRSDTTLVEQILATHLAVHGAGERSCRRTAFWRSITKTSSPT